MKKFCSTCGNQLELSQRFCNQCGAVNPFFVSAFTFLSDQSDELEKLRLEKERIDKELAEKEEKQAEFVKQEQLRREAEESEKLKVERLEKERIRREQLELEKMETNLKEELLKVKEETIQHQKETIDLVKEVREELIQMEAGNKKLKEEIAILSKATLTEKPDGPASAATPGAEKVSKERGMVVSLLVILLGLTSVLAFFYFSNRHEDTSDGMPVAANQDVVLKPADVTPIPTDTILEIDTAAKVVDTIKPAEVAAPVPVKTEPKMVKPEAVAAKPKSEFILTADRVIKDMVGKRISGCDITVGSGSEIESVSNLVLVEKMASGSMKFKFTAIIQQDGETYTAAPYIYYSASGAFVKMDGTNCE